MKIRCPQCKQHFDYDPGSGPARCPYEGCGWVFENKAEKPSTALEIGPEQQVKGAETLSVSPAPPDSGSMPEFTGRGLPAHRQRPAAESRINTVRCPGCSSPVPDTELRCHVCGTNLEKAFGELRGLRAVFDVSGDITFTPTMVVFLFLATLGAFLTFTWILSNKDRGSDYVPLVLSDTAHGQTGKFNRALQGISFLQLKNELLDPRNTDLRKEMIAEKFIGQRVIWSGLLKKVSAGEYSYQLEIVMEGPQSDSFVTLQALKMPNNDRMVANISRGQSVLFSGKISAFDTGGATSAYDYFRIVLQDGIILE
jgi:hypothetical protein